MIAVYIAITALVVFGTVWAIFDAFERTSLGCLWLYLLCAFPGLALIVYLVMRYSSDRAYGQARIIDVQQDQPTFSRFPTEIEKAKFIEASTYSGTMYEPEQQAYHAKGFMHFTEDRAETLISERRYDEAAEYLGELLAIARSEHDHRAIDTYRYYISRIPGGIEQVEQQLAAAEQEQPAYKPPEIDLPKERGSRPGREDIPF